jgi:hypothetical protein
MVGIPKTTMEGVPLKRNVFLFMCRAFYRQGKLLTWRNVKKNMELLGFDVFDKTKSSRVVFTRGRVPVSLHRIHGRGGKGYAKELRSYQYKSLSKQFIKGGIAPWMFEHAGGFSEDESDESEEEEEVYLAED